jgi:hypothetical protein
VENRHACGLDQSATVRHNGSMRMISLTLTSSLAIVAGITTSCSRADDADVAAVNRVIARTKATTTTYALYQWTRLTPPGGRRVEEWAAEFNAGNLHRVETPRDRVIADCRAKTGMWLTLATGQVVRGERVAGAACGIKSDKPMLRMEMLGQVTTPNGKADRVRITDADNIRTYEVSADGILVHAVYQANSAASPVVLDSNTAGLERKLPATDMFSEASLRTSFVPATYRIAPRRR